MFKLSLNEGVGFDGAAMVRVLLLVFCSLLVSAGVALGEPVIPSFSRAAGARVDAISFLLVGYLVFAWIYRRCWNSLGRDLPQLPTLSYRGALGVMVACGLVMAVILTMISGARELMGSAPWARSGGVAKLREPEADPKLWLAAARQASLERVRTDLWLWAQNHGNAFPANREDLPESTWQSIDPTGALLMYFPGAKPEVGSDVIVCEPASFGPERYVLRSNGEIVQVPLKDLLTEVDSQIERADPGRRKAASGAEREASFSPILGMLYLVYLAIGLVFGWIFHLVRVVPSVGFGMGLDGVLALLAATYGLHQILRRLPVEGQRPRWALTLKIIAMILLTCGSSIAATGIIHQAGWLFRTPNWIGFADYDRVVKELKDIKQVGIGLALFADDHQGKFPESLGELVPEYLPESAMLYSRSAEELPERFTYFPGFTKNAPADQMLLCSPRPMVFDGLRRACISLDISGQTVTEAEFRERLKRQLPREERGQ